LSRVRTNDHIAPWLEKFAAAASAVEEVVELYRLAGEVDYLLQAAGPRCPRRL